MTRAGRNKRHQAGVGLLEVLIALLILAIGALGYAGLQLTALRNSDDANYRAHAAMIAQDAIERIKSNPAAADQYATAANWPASAGTSSPADWKQCMNGACNAAQLAEWDMKQLVWAVSTTMPGGRITAQDCGFNTLDCVIVSWGEQVPAECISNGGIDSSDESSCLVMEVVR
tara:strand:+ start:340 stop:858 length:519 start_codon:yes stop_codon:yes gene_type:complete